MAKKPQFKYFSGAEADSLTFYRIPKILIKDEFFKDMSSNSKLLYGLCLDRMSLSVKNGWIDGENRAFIYYTREQIMDDLAISKNTAKTAIDQLVEYGLLEIKKQGLGKSDTLYLKNFVTENETYRLKIRETRRSEIDPLSSSEDQNLTPNNNNKTIKLYSSVSNPILSNRDTMRCDASLTKKYETLVKDNIELEILLSDHPNDRSKIIEVYDLIVEMLVFASSTEEKILIASARYPADLVVKRFMNLKFFHVEYVLDQLQRNASDVRNIKKYILATLFNASVTMDSYYSARVNYDFKNGAKKVMGDI